MTSIWIKYVYMILDSFCPGKENKKPSWDCLFWIGNKTTMPLDLESFQWLFPWNEHILCLIIKMSSCCNHYQYQRRGVIGSRSPKSWNQKKATTSKSKPIRSSQTVECYANREQKDAKSKTSFDSILIRNGLKFIRPKEMLGVVKQSKST